MPGPAARFVSQALAGPPLASPHAVARRLLAIQAQEPRGFRLAVRARTRGLVASDVDAAIDRGELVVNWLVRRTLHLVAREDHDWLHALTAPAGERWTAQRLAGLGLSAREMDRGVGELVAALAHGPLRRAQLRERLTVPAGGQRLVHLLALACYRGEVVRGPGSGREQAFVARREWLGEPARVERDAALAELALRHGAGHAASTDRDLARWSGLGLREVRRGLAAVARPPDPPAELPPPTLLGPFDPVLHGWTDRTWISSHDVVTVNGVFRACALVEGRVVATWRGDVELAPLEAFDPGLLEAEAADVRRFEAGAARTVASPS